MKNIRIIYDFDEYKKELKISDDFKVFMKDYLSNGKILRNKELDIDYKKYRRITRLIDDMLKDDLQFELDEYLFECYINEELKDEIILTGAMDVIPVELYEEMDRIIPLDIK